METASGLERAVVRAGRQRDARVAASPGLRRRRGIVHTPPEIARFAVRAADARVRELGRPGGLADPQVAVLDPACGPGAFVAATLAVTARRRARGPRALVGLDRDAEALSVARAAIGGTALQMGRPVVFRHAETLATLQPWPHAVGSDTTVVVVGNPPWAGRTANRDAAVTEELLDDFRRDAQGQPLGERKIGVLSDDYVRFWRWSAEIARGAGGGAVVALVTNASFLDGIVHRGMRAALLRWFDGIDVLDLGGSALVARTKARDDNLFGVRPGAALTIAWRAASDPDADATDSEAPGLGGDDIGNSGPHGTVTRLRCAELRGSRPDKLEWLARTHPWQLEWERAAPGPPLHLFRVAEPADRPSAELSVSLAEALPFHREGVQTNRDGIVVEADPRVLLERLHAFAQGHERQDLAAALQRSAHFAPERARRAVCDALERDPRGEHGVSLERIAYRPYDTRWFAPVAPLCHRPRNELRAAVRRSAFALLTVRKDRGRQPWAHFGASRWVVDNCWLSARSSCRTRAFPTHTPAGKPNLDERIATWCAERIEREIDSTEFALYALGVLAAPRYRRDHDAALHVDYPRIPLPVSARAWSDRVAAGRAVRDAFCGPDTDAHGPAPSRTSVRVGHVELASPPRALGEAIAQSERAYVAHCVR